MFDSVPQLTGWGTTRVLKPTRRKGYACPHCKQLISWMPMPRFSHCHRCGGSLDWKDS